MRKLWISSLAACLLAPWVTAWPASERQLVVVSDLHVGAGRDAERHWRSIEDFRWDAEFAEFLQSLNTSDGPPANLVLAGDSFELWQSPTMVCSQDLAKPGCAIPDCHEDDRDLGCTEAEAVARLEYVLGQHQEFVAAVRKFATITGNRVVFVPGNHDAALLFEGVREALLRRFTDLPVEVESAGYWLSSDGAVYVDHGHQSDLLNDFVDWPAPFVLSGGERYLRKPWGENMVQSFYNQYEYLFPIIDNLSQESAGVSYAIRQAGLQASAEAIGRIFRFLLYEQSLRQAITGLGAEDPLAWDYVAVRKLPPEFFIEGLAQWRDASQAAQQALSEGRLAFDASEISAAEIDALCQSKLTRRSPRTCPTRDRSLGSALRGAFFSDDEIRVAYLRRVLPKVARRPGIWPTAYVYGHTHSAAVAQRLNLGDAPGGTKEIQYANTGAFQRVVSPDQIKAILAKPSDRRARGAMDLQPEDLPPCYNFVRVKPYTGQPTLELLRWAAPRGGRFSASPGTCLSRAVD